MTIGKDVSAVFAEVTSCSQTADLELKKLVYLYLINYAKTQPELAIMAVNTFVKVCPYSSRPLLRGLCPLSSWTLAVLSFGLHAQGNVFVCLPGGGE